MVSATEIKGIGSAFKKECVVGSTIKVKDKFESIIVEVKDDSTLIIKDPGIEHYADYLSQEFEYKVIPKID